MVDPLRQLLARRGRGQCHAVAPEDLCLASSDGLTRFLCGEFSVTFCLVVERQPQRREPAATERRMRTELNGWLPFAARGAWVASPHWSGGPTNSIPYLAAVDRSA